MVTIGRDLTCGIILDDPDVSRSHVKLGLDTSGVRVEDLRSGNGTFVDEKRVTSGLWLPGQTLRLGGVRLKWSSDGSLASREAVGGAAPKQVAPHFILTWKKQGDGKSRSYSMPVSPGKVLTVGRDPACDIVLEDQIVSYCHARLEVLPDCVNVQRLSRTNQTRIAGKGIAEGKWSVGQVLSIGHYDFSVQVDLRKQSTGRAQGAPKAARATQRPEIGRDERPPELHVSWQLKDATKNSKPKSIKIEAGRTLIVGSAPGCDIVLDHPEVSRRHASIEFRSGSLHIEDLNSTNGMKLDGHPVKAGPWSAGQVLDIAPYTLSIHDTAGSDIHNRALSALYQARRSLVPPDAAHKERLRVFISYSRSDMAPADKLTVALEQNGFEVMIDRRDLPYGEKWQHELTDFIRIADTVLFLVTANSIKSDWCVWELQLTQHYRKRLFPLAIAPVAIQNLPVEIRLVQMLPATGNFNFDRDLPQLVKSLNTDRAWVKQYTRLSDRAREWRSRGRPAAMQLRGAELRLAEDWAAARPKSEFVSDEVHDLIVHSRNARRLGRVKWSGALAAQIGVVVFAVLLFNELLNENARLRILPYIERALASVSPSARKSDAERLAEYRSGFFGRLKAILGSRSNIIIGDDRITFQSEVLFPSGQAQLTADGQRVLDLVSIEVKGLSSTIPGDLPWVLQVDGHTDKRPISNSSFPSNLELSTARAISAVRYLVSQGVSADRLVAAGHGEFNPLDTGDSAESLQRNRRIELRLTNR